MMCCRHCREPMTLDRLIAADALRALDPGPVVMRCRNGHSERYRGAVTAFQPPAQLAEVVVPAGPDFPEIPAAWLDGFRRIYAP